MNKPTHVYIARNDCGCCIGVAVDLRNRNTGKSVGGFISDGLYIERVDWETYREKIQKEKTFLSCPHGQSTLRLDPVGEVDKGEKQA